MLIDGMRYPLQKQIASNYDPSIIPTLALERSMFLPTRVRNYGSDAAAGSQCDLETGFMSGDQFGSGRPTTPTSIPRRLCLSAGNGHRDVTMSLSIGRPPGMDGGKRDYFTTDFTPWVSTIILR